MPKETFGQIDAEKRERVLLEAAKLFSKRGFAQTDMAELARRAGVAKGSLYNYFESKEDCYLTVCKDGLERSRRAVYTDIGPDWDVYRQTDHIFRRGAEFALAHPEYVRLYLSTTSAELERFAEEISLEAERPTADRLKSVLRAGIKQGIVRSDVDVNMTAYVINGLYILLLASLASPHFEVRARAYLEFGSEMSGETFEAYVNRTIDYIHNLMRPPNAARIVRKKDGEGP